jgi:putative transposase
VAVPDRAAQGILAADLVLVDTVRLGRICALIIIEHGTGRAYLPASSPIQMAPGPTQAARNFLMDAGHRADAALYLIRDRVGQFTDSFDAVFTAAGIRILFSPPQVTKANAICERMIGTLRRELLDRLLFLDEHHLRQARTEYLRDYNTRLTTSPAGARADG